MRILFILLAGTILIYTGTSCSSNSSKETGFCDTACIKDTLKFEVKIPDNIRVYISAKNCVADTVHWTNIYLDSWLKLDLGELTDPAVRINTENVMVHFADTSFAWLELKDCGTGRGYLAKLNFNKKEKRSRYSSALTRFDAKNSIEDGLIAYFDRVFIYVQNVKTGEVQQVKIAANTGIEFDYDHFHDYLDSVNITSKRVFAKVKQTTGGEWVEIEKNISFK